MTFEKSLQTAKKNFLVNWKHLKQTMFWWQEINDGNVLEEEKKGKKVGFRHRGKKNWKENRDAENQITKPLDLINYRRKWIVVSLVCFQWGFEGSRFWAESLRASNSLQKPTRRNLKWFNPFSELQSCYKVLKPKRLSDFARKRSKNESCMR